MSLRSRMNVRSRHAWWQDIDRHLEPEGLVTEADKPDCALGAFNWPTREEYLDVYFLAIVATCRSVLNTSSPARAWKDCDVTKNER